MTIASYHSRKVERITLKDATTNQCDYLVARAKGRLPKSMNDWSKRWPSYCTDASAFEETAELHRICVYWNNGGWWAYSNELHQTDSVHRGPETTRLTAAVKCYLHLIYGDRPIVPEEAV